MAIREDETAADCTGVNPITTKLLAFALGASFSGFAGSVYAAKLQAITPGAFEFQVSIMLLCMVVLGRRGQPGRRDRWAAMLITLFDRVLLSQMTTSSAASGRTTGIAGADHDRPHALALVLLRPRPGRSSCCCKPEGLLGRRVRPVAIPDVDEPVAVAERAAAPRVEAIPGWLRERAAGAARRARGAPLLEVRGVVQEFGGVIALNEVDLVVPRGAIIGLIGPNGAGKTTFFNVVTGLSRPDSGQHHLRGRRAWSACGPTRSWRAASRAPSSRSGSSST